MMEIWSGKPVADSMMEEIAARVSALKQNGTIPTLAVVRLGEDPSDIAYEKGILKRAADVGMLARQFVYERNMTQEDMIGAIRKLNEDPTVHGVMMFRPLPHQMNDSAVCGALLTRKDVDGVTYGSMAGVFTGSGEGYPPCTAEACIRLLDYYGVELGGKKVTVFGRSLVVGRPVAMMAMERNATVTICHSRTAKEDFDEAGRNADIVIAAVGRANFINSERLGSGQIVLDVGINESADGSLCGDVDIDTMEKARAVTPVPGGIGSVTTAVLMSHVLEAAEKSSV